MFLIIYVDDFKLAGKKQNFSEAWRRIVDGGIVLDEPSALNHFLGCRHIKSEVVRADNSVVTTMEYDFESSLRNSVARYKSLAKGCGVEVKLRKCATPYRGDPEHEHRVPHTKGPCVACPWCQTPFAPEEFRQYDSVEALDAERQTNKKRIVVEIEALKAENNNPSYGASGCKPVSEGRLASIASKILMQVLYAARFARSDLIRCINGLACNVTRWTAQQDAELNDLMSYVESTLTWKTIGWVGDPLEAVAPHLYADSDLGGCPVTERSTSGYYMVARGPNTCFPIAFGCKRQSSCANCTAESELTSMNYALRHCGLPSLTLWETLLPSFIYLLCHEDNQAMIRVCVTGRNPTMRYLSRTQGLNVGWLYERFQSPELELEYTRSSDMAADIFTKSFTCKIKWLEVCRLVNIVDKDVFYDLIAHSHAPSVVPTAGGGKTRDQPATPAPQPAKAKGRHAERMGARASSPTKEVHAE